MIEGVPATSFYLKLAGMPLFARDNDRLLDHGIEKDRTLEMAPIIIKDGYGEMVVIDVCLSVARYTCNYKVAVPDRRRMTIGDLKRNIGHESVLNTDGFVITKIVDYPVSHGMPSDPKSAIQDSKSIDDPFHKDGYHMGFDEVLGESKSGYTHCTEDGYPLVLYHSQSYDISLGSPKSVYGYHIEDDHDLIPDYLEFHGVPLNESMTMYDHGIEDGHQLLLRPRRPNEKLTD